MSLNGTEALFLNSATNEPETHICAFDCANEQQKEDLQ